MPYRVTERIGGGEHERRDGHKAHYFLVITAIGDADHEGGLPSDDLSETSAGLIGLTIADGIPQNTAVHWSFYSDFPQHYEDYESIWELISTSLIWLQRSQVVLLIDNEGIAMQVTRRQ